jgi:hypothetical protein
MKKSASVARRYTSAGDAFRRHVPGYARREQGSDGMTGDNSQDQVRQAVSQVAEDLSARLRRRPRG